MVQGQLSQPLLSSTEFFVHFDGAGAQTLHHLWRLYQPDSDVLHVLPGHVHLLAEDGASRRAALRDP